MPLSHICLVLFVMILWGGNFIAIKVGLDSFPPLLFSAFRFILTAFPIIFFIGERDAPWKIIIGFGLVLGVAKFSFLFIGMDMGVTAGIASLVLQSQAFFTVILAALLVHERPTGFDWCGLFIAFSGMAMIGMNMGGGNSLIGLLFVIIAGFFWAVANLIMKQAGKANMLKLIVYMSLAPPIPLLLLSLQFEGPERIYESIVNLRWAGALSLAYIVIAATLFGFAIWGMLLSKYPAAKVAPFSLLVPIFGMTLSALILGESFGKIQLIGAAAVMAGLILINAKPFFQRKRDVSVAGTS